MIHQKKKKIITVKMIHPLLLMKRSMFSGPEQYIFQNQKFLEFTDSPIWVLTLPLLLDVSLKVNPS